MPRRLRLRYNPSISTTDSRTVSRRPGYPPSPVSPYPGPGGPPILTTNLSVFYWARLHPIRDHLFHLRSLYCPVHSSVRFSSHVTWSRPKRTSPDLSQNTDVRPGEWTRCRLRFPCRRRRRSDLFPERKRRKRYRCSRLFFLTLQDDGGRGRGQSVVSRTTTASGTFRPFLTYIHNPVPSLTLLTSSPLRRCRTLGVLKGDIRGLKETSFGHEGGTGWDPVV